MLAIPIKIVFFRGLTIIRNIVGKLKHRQANAHPIINRYWGIHDYHLKRGSLTHQKLATLSWYSPR